MSTERKGIRHMDIAFGDVLYRPARDKTAVRDLVDFFVPMGLWPKWSMTPVTRRAKAAAVAEALR